MVEVAATSSVPVVPLMDLGQVDTAIYPAAQVRMPYIQVFSNADERMARMTAPAYAARVGQPEAVNIMVLPAGTVIRGDAGWVVEANGALVREQLPPNGSAPAQDDHCLAEDPVPVEVGGEIMLIARYGFLTWGHWLGELLPKIAVLEKQQPGRFTYALPKMAFDISQRRLYGTRLAESLEAYGVATSRVLMLDRRPLCFDRLYAMTNVWTDHMMHPSVLADMREGVGVHEMDRPVPGRRIALLRGDNTRRQIGNSEEVKSLFGAKGFDIVDVAEQSFSQQVSIFATAEMIFSILGSSLTGLIYACRDIGVVAGAPEHFGDRFFYAIMQARGARYAEVRGPVLGEPNKLYRDSTFALPVAPLEHAIDQLQSS